MDVAKRQILRYLGYGTESADEETSLAIKQLTAELKECIAPKKIFGVWSCQVDPPIVSIDNMTITSMSLSTHINGCRRVALLAATLGTGADALIRKHSVRDMEKTVIADAVCAAMVEAYCDEIEDQIARKENIQKQYFTSRFSPGYGDLDMICQWNILRFLNCGRVMGLAMTDGAMLVPSKSVVAIIGLKENLGDA